MAAPPEIPARAKIGFPSRPIINPVTNTVATTPTLILRNNPDRIYWLIVNLSPNDGYAGWDAQVSPTRGILIPANGGYASVSIVEDGELAIMEVYAINLTASGTWMIVEIERI